MLFILLETEVSTILFTKGAFKLVSDLHCVITLYNVMCIYIYVCVHVFFAVDLVLATLPLVKLF